MLLKSYAHTVEEFAEKAVAVGLYRSKEEFLRAVLTEMARNEVGRYKREIARYEKKYGSFEGYGKKIHGKAMPKEEDVWMSWESVRGMLGRWGKATKELGLGA